MAKLEALPKGKLNESQKDVLRIARSVIRDLAKGWTIKELQEPPEVICDKLSLMLRERYDFEEGKVTP